MFLCVFELNCVSKNDTYLFACPSWVLWRGDPLFRQLVDSLGCPSPESHSFWRCEPQGLPARQLPWGEVSSCRCRLWPGAFSEWFGSRVQSSLRRTVRIGRMRIGWLVGWCCWSCSRCLPDISWTTFGAFCLWYFLFGSFNMDRFCVFKCYLGSEMWLSVSM